MGTEKKIRRALFTALLCIIAVATHAATLTTSSSACVDESVKIEVTDLSGVEYVDFKRSTDNGSTWTNVGRAVVKDGKAEMTDFMTTNEQHLYKVVSYPTATVSVVSETPVTLKTTDCPKSSACHTTSSGEVFDGTDFSVVGGGSVGSGEFSKIENFLPENNIVLESGGCSNGEISSDFLEKYGGHEMAVGLSLKKDKFN